MEGLLRKIWKEILNVEIPNPIPHMQYDEAMSTFGSDRPDLRFGMELHDITDLGKQTDFKVFKTRDGEVHRRAGRIEAHARADRCAGGMGKGFGAKGWRSRRSTGSGFDTDAQVHPPIAQKLIERTGAKDGDLLAFAPTSRRSFTRSSASCA
jgi:aspartyl-tRNA synthetase